MHESYQAFEQRKRDHLALALNTANQASEMNAFDFLRLAHEAIPDGNLEDVSLATTLLDKPCSTPFFISSMTAGHADAPKLNRILMEACSHSGWAMGVGSQRRELSDSSAIDDWKKLRSDFSKVRLMSNLGLAQVIHTPIARLERLVESIEAVAFIIHCNPLQECIQPEGTPHFKGAWQALKDIARALSVPLIIKETGCGFSAETLMRLGDVGIHTVDVSGLGGTHWGRIEGARSEEASLAYETAQRFKNWGITTVESLQFARQLALPYDVWASGGIRHGLDAAKAIALGARAVGFAKVMLASALEGVDTVVTRMQDMEHTLRVAMFCTGSFTVDALREKPCL